jgi:hypothetical protein
VQVTPMLFQKFFGNKTIYMTLDKGCFSNSIVADYNDFHLSLGLIKAVRSRVYAQNLQIFVTQVKSNVSMSKQHTIVEYDQKS